MLLNENYYLFDEQLGTAVSKLLNEFVAKIMGNNNEVASEQFI